MTPGRARYDRRPRRESTTKRLGKRRTRWVLARDGHRCVYCGADEGPLHFDHVTPRTLGGTDSVHNLVVACAACNCAKQNKPPRAWYAYLRARLGWTHDQTRRASRRVRRRLAIPSPWGKR